VQQFLVENILLVGLAVASGLMLIVHSIKHGNRTGGLTPTQATQAINQRHAVLVDVRAPSVFAGGHLAQSRNIPAAELEAKAGSLPKNKPLILVCGNGRESAKAVATLKAKGFEDVNSLQGGVTAWVQAGLPITKG